VSLQKLPRLGSLVLFASMHRRWFRMTAMSKNKERNAKVQANRQPSAISHRRVLPASTYLVYAILVLCCFVLLLPVFVSYRYYYPYIFLKNILFRSAVQAMAFIYLILALVSPEYKPRFSRIHYALFAWFGMMLLCSLPGVSSNAWKSWWGDFPRMDGMFTQLHLLAFFLVIAQTFRRERHWLTLFTASLFSSVLVGLTALIQQYGINLVFRFTPEPLRIGASTGNPDFLGSFLLFNICIALYLLVRKGKRDFYPSLAIVWNLLIIVTDVALVVWDFASNGQIFSMDPQAFPLYALALVLHGISFLWFFMRRSVWIGTFFIGLICLNNLYWLNQTQTRASVVGLAGALLFVALLYVWNGTGRLLKWTAVLLILLFAVFSIILLRSRDSAWVQQYSLLARFSATSLGERRFVGWKAGALGVVDRPILGWGLENYRKAFDPHAPAQIFQGPGAEHWDDRAHNIILDAGTTTGLLGLAAMLTFYGMLLLLLLRGWLKNREATEYLSVAGLLVAYLIQNFFIFDTINTHGILFLVLAYATYLCTRIHPDPGEDPARQTTERWSLNARDFAILATAAGILVCAWHYLVQEPLNSNLLLQRGIASEVAPGRQSDTPLYVFGDSILHDFQRAEEYQTTGRYQVREELANYVIEIVRVPGITLPEKARAARQALSFIGKSVLEDPGDARHYMYGATLTNAIFNVLKQSDSAEALRSSERALTWLQKAESLGPNRPRLYMERARLLLHLGRTDEAISAHKKALSLDPHSKPIHVELVATYIIAGRYADAESEWKKIRSYPGGVSAGDYERLANLYASKKQLTPLIALYKEQLQQLPNDPVVMARLATAYRETGDMDAARQTALEAAKISPEAAAQVEEFLKTLSKK
jgi:tetratricopeptide (TPR) repeat protein